MVTRFNLVRSFATEKDNQRVFKPEFLFQEHFSD